MFTLTDVEKANAAAFRKEYEVKAAEYQKTIIKHDDPFYSSYEFCWENNMPYCGAVGGQFSYTFTPTSVGPAVVIRDNVTKEERNITDYSMW